MQSASASLANWWERVKEIKQGSKLGDVSFILELIDAHSVLGLSS